MYIRIIASIRNPDGLLVIMWKTLVVLAFVAGTFLITPSEGTPGCKEPPTTIKPCGPKKPHHKCSKPNEVFDACPNPCPPRECGVNKALILCAPAPKPGSRDCEPGCRCADGYLRNKETGYCIPEDQCPIKCPKNETLDPCLSSCPPRLCGVNIAAVSCPDQDPDDCEPGCRCKDDYRRNAEGFCVHKDDCPTCTEPNTVYDICPAPCPPRRCDVDDRVIRCAAPPKPGDPECQPGCRCKDGYVTNDDGKCVTRDQCPKCKGKHEIFDSCPSNCPPQTCESIGKTYHCPKAPSKCPKGKCVCEPGYFRNKLGECISKEDCLKCNGTHEYFSCGGACDNVCATLKKKNQTHCPIVNIMCNRKCYCEAGYARDDKNICVPFDQCNALECGKNEIISKCPDFECRPLKCSQVGFPLNNCPENRTKCPGKPACVCKNRYVRNREGKCIPIEDCPSCGGDPNSVSGCGVNCGKHCYNLKDKQPVACIDICYENACDCRPGYVFDDNTKRCVLPKKCTPVCGKNEVYSNCTNGNCQPQNCSQLGHPIPCKKIEPCDCIKGCLCKDGYVRNKEGICILIKDCPPVCGKNEVYSNCTNGNCQPQNCSQLGHPIPCKKIEPCDCIKGCLCKDGYVRNKEGICILIKDCPPVCGKNEVYSNCTNGNCQPQNCSQLGHPIPCKKIEPCDCIKGCLCKDGYVRNKEGICILIKDCPPVCGKNEVYSNCTNGNCQPQNCSQLGHPIPCKKIEPCDCIKGCLCKDGYVRNKEGICILIKDCPPVCGKNEVYSNCTNGNCQPQNCSQLGHPIPCKKIEPCDCIKGCLCKDGYVRNKEGICILIKDCPPVCGKNEVYSNCTNGNCQPQKCSQLGYPIPCKKIEPCDCIKGCLCKDGYVRNKEGICIPKRKCPSCGGDPNSESGCGVNCGKHCSDKGKDPGPCPDICNTNGCDCKKGFLLDDSTGKCIPSDQCVSCGGDYNAEPGCDKDCRQRCPGPKPDECKCQKDSCKCKPGFEYDPKSGKCVRPENCSPPCGDNEVLSPCSNGGCGPWTCSDVGFPTGCVKIDPKYCRVGCICKEGYVKNNGTCIPVKECPPVCGKNEVYSECANGGCQAKNCSQLGKPVPCVKPHECQPGCICAEGYLRNYDGICVPKDQCPPTCTGQNEIYVRCPSDCPPETCESIGKKYNCPLEPADKTSKDCHGACRCKPGYRRNKIGECISVEDCKKCTRPNEYFSCGRACDNVCETLSEMNQTNCPIYNIQCVEMCYCEPDYARDSYNTCIPIDQCPKCGKNERLEQCPDWSCAPQSCKQLGFPIECPLLPPSSNATCPGPPKCVCDYDYVRDGNGKCIPKKHCPSCGGDPNAESGCGLNCGKLCSNYDKGPVPCPKICYPNACDCKDGYVYDVNIKKCVRPKHCTPVCKENEVYDKCANGGCGKRNCSQLGQPDICKDVIKCIGGCVCQKDYLRAHDGTCIPQNKCPAPSCGKNERYVKCPDFLCEPQTCSQLGYPVVCPIVPSDERCPGEPGCVCEQGYVRNPKGICIPKKHCPSCGGDPNAESGCGNNCGKLCSNYNKGPVPCTKICKVNSCDCKKDYVLDLNTGKCVLPKHCTPICGRDEEFSECINGGCQPKNCSQLGKPVPCVKIDPKYCIKGCLCKDGYLRDHNGICIPKDKCNKCNKPNEHYEVCPPRCPPQTCESIGRKYKCPKPSKELCRGACRCDKGHYRNKDGECVPAKDCLPKCGPGERLEQCPASLCTPQTCSQLGFPINCTGLSGNPNATCPGPPGCVCDNNDYVKDERGKCIPKTDCPSCGGDRNAKTGCGIHCGNRCSDKKSNPKFCPLLCIQNSCDCKEGYKYDENLKKCVLPCDCTPVCGVNEVYDTCANGGCQKRNCSQVGQFKLCLDPIKCIGGCVCKKGYLKARNGSCIPEDQCPGEPIEKCEKPHEVYVRCPPICPPQTCESIGKKYSCPAMIIGKNCKGACRCEKGYYRNKNGECISEKDCLKCKGRHEYFSCGRACDNVCATLSEQNQTNCPIKDKKCVPMCYCEKGYARDDKNICVPIDKCPESCGGDPNAVKGCGNNCGKLCSDYKKKNVACPLICKIDGCECKKGFVYDSNLRKCVHPKDCTPICGRDEVFSECINGGCQPKNCSQLGKPVPCVKIDPKYCIKGCLCKDGYLRDHKGICIPKDKCNKCNKPNEHYEACPLRCPPQTCESIGRKYKCPKPSKELCRGACRCDKGHYRNKDGECVPAKDCSPRCGPDEIYEKNPSKVCYPLDCTEVGFPIDCPPVEDSDCEDTPACICKKGLVRSSCGHCIPKSQCPSCGGDPNAVSGCGNKCGRSCSDYGQDVVCNKRCYENGCDCKENFVYDEIAKKCVRYENCTQTSTTKPPSKVNVTEARDQLDLANIALTGELLYELISSKPEENSVASGMSVLLPLALLYLFTVGEANKELSKLLNVDEDQAKAVLPLLTKEFNSNQSNIEYGVANKYYASELNPLSDIFKQYSREYLDADGGIVDFGKPVEAADTMNAWVSNRTHGRIVDLISPDSLNANTRLVLLNAIYFKGDWKYKFNSNDTKTKDFYKSNGDTVPVEMMYQQNKFDYTENDYCQALRLEYVNNNFSFIIVLPKTTYSLLDTAKIFKDPKVYRDIVGNLTKQNVKVSFPKFLTRTKLDLVEILKKLNVTSIFDPNSNEIKGVLNNNEPLSVSDAVQQGFITVNEEGSEAAAATAVIIQTRSLPISPEPIYIFNANRPFLFYITFKGVVLFCGAFVE